jgi:hypothetical protein
MIKRVIVGTAMAAAGWAAYYNVRRWWATWGADPADADRALPGDDLVTGASAEDTRGITIDAPPESVWPWVVQMGYGRAGWYSYDRLDMRGESADRIVPEWQQLEVGDTLPTHPDGGFDVRVLDPGRALVLYVDSAIAERWRAKARERRSGATMPPGLAASGQFLDTTMPREFAASWAFVVEPAGEGRARLVERFRFRGAEDAPGARAMGALLGFGVFVMAQRHMVGLKQRAERSAVAMPHVAAAQESPEALQPA